jgi:N-acetylglucosaminyldiphosphoundecaprenol N-acetyl-beta-D-mannosaminyltransferase
MEMAEPALEPGRNDHGPHRRFTLLGVDLDAVTSEQLVEAAIRQVECGSGSALFGHHNLHSLHLFHRSSEMRRFYAQCQLTHVDGMSLVMLGRMMGLPLERCHRTTYLDWIEEFLKAAADRCWTIYILGGPPEFAMAVPDVLYAKFPGLAVKTHHGFVTDADDDSILEEITACEPEIVMVGMGMPRQEEWILRNRGQLKAPILFSCGAAFEYLAGVQQRPPRWAGQMGVEWLFRLVMNPRRLASRYLVEPIHLLPLLMRAAVGRLSGSAELAKMRSEP